MQQKTTKRFDDFEVLKREVERNQGILTLQMGDLRDAYGVKRLGKLVLDGISRKLDGLGLGHYPIELPDSQNDYARIYKRGTPVSDIINAVLELSADNDKILREKSASDDSELLKQVRELVCP